MMQGYIFTIYVGSNSCAELVKYSKVYIYIYIGDRLERRLHNMHMHFLFKCIQSNVQKYLRVWNFRIIQYRCTCAIITN